MKCYSISSRWPVRLVLLVAPLLIVILYPALAFSDNAISTCGVIASPGTYDIENDITSHGALGGACLVLHDTTDVTLDCHGHTIEVSNSGGYQTPPALEIARMKNFNVRNCHFDGLEQIVRIEQSSYGVFENNQFSRTNRNALTYIAASYVDHLTIQKNIFYAMWEQIHVTDTILENNAFTCPADPSHDICWALIMSQLGGQRNTYSGNNIEGGLGVKSDGSKKAATDDGILLEDESDSVVDHNVINDVFDMGIENLGQLTNVKITSNRIKNLCQAGFGGWYYSNLVDNLFADNDVTCDKMLLYYRIGGLRPAKYDMPADTALLFTNNIFSGNRLRPPAGTKRAAISLPIYEPSMSIQKNSLTISRNKSVRTSGTPQFHPYYDEAETMPKKVVLINNVFRDNDFGSEGSFNFDDGSPNAAYNADFIIDGGGNKCIKNASSSKFSPINCQ